MANVLEIIKNEITQDYYKNNFPNDGQRFIAWYRMCIREMCIRDSYDTQEETWEYKDENYKSIIPEDLRWRKPYGLPRPGYPTYRG